MTCPGPRYKPCAMKSWCRWSLLGDNRQRVLLPRGVVAGMVFDTATRASQRKRSFRLKKLEWNEVGLVFDGPLPVVPTVGDPSDRGAAFKEAFERMADQPDGKSLGAGAPVRNQCKGR